MIRCLAVDDEVYATKMIADYIAKVPYLEQAGATTNAIEALSRSKMVILISFSLISRCRNLPASSFLNFAVVNVK
jgi:hypothetical protein